MTKDMCASALPSGSRASHEAPAGLHPTGFDPSRVEPVRPNFAEFSEALLIAGGLYNDVELAFWLNAPQPMLSMWTPIQLLARGEADKLLQVLRQLEDGVYV